MPNRLRKPGALQVLVQMMQNVAAAFGGVLPPWFASGPQRIATTESVFGDRPEVDDRRSLINQAWSPLPYRHPTPIPPINHRRHESKGPVIDLWRSHRLTGFGVDAS